MQGSEKDCGANLPDSKARRRVIKKIVTGVSVLAGYSALPEQWTRPVVGQISLPAHAATSGISLHDSCSVTLVSGDQSSTEVSVHVTGFVSPPTENLAVLIVADESETVVVATAADGTFQGDVTISGGPGIETVDVMTTVSEADGRANCSVAVPAAPAPAPAALQKAPETDGNTPSGEYNSSEVYTMRWMAVHNRAFTWLNRTGASYGGPVKFVFTGGCGELYVQNPANDFNRSHPSAAVYFCGTNNKPEESNGTKASIFGPSGCRATKVTVYYNK